MSGEEVEDLIDYGQGLLDMGAAPEAVRRIMDQLARDRGVTPRQREEIYRRLGLG